MSLQDDLDEIFAKLGVEQEQSADQPPALEVLSFTQVSHSHPGVFYRLDLTGSEPELRVYIPDEGVYKTRIYLVRLSPHCFLGNLFALYLTSQSGSAAWQEIEGMITMHQFLATTEAMKGLFWQGDLVSLQFPPEIDVRCLL